MDPTQGEKPPQKGIAPSNTSSTSTEKDHPLTSQPPAQPKASADQKQDKPVVDSSKEANTDDTVTIKPGDELSEAILAAQEAIEAAQEPATGRAKPKTDTIIVPGAGRMQAAPLGRHSGPLDERKATYRRWLEEKSKDDLIEMIVNLEAHESAPAEHTEKISIRPRFEEVAAQMPPEGYQVPDDLTFVRLPVVRKTAVNEPTPTWRIVLVAIDQSTRPLGLQIDSEITIGRVAGDANPDLDLTPFGAKSKGVSRIHARLRPEMHSLILIDNNSSNGTFWNKVRLPPENDQALRDGDVITFGRVNFLVKIVKSPSTQDTRTLL